MCMTSRPFRLMHVHAWSDVGYYAVKCAVCGYAREVPESESAAALAALDLFSRWTSSDMALQDYVHEFEQLGFHTVLTMDLEGSFWWCSSCGEKVPQNFLQCWNCQAMRLEIS